MDKVAEIRPEDFGLSLRSLWFDCLVNQLQVPTIKHEIPKEELYGDCRQPQTQTPIVTLTHPYNRSFIGAFKGTQWKLSGPLY